MRTVSFSSATVRDKLQKEFVCYSLNTAGDPSSGASIAHAPTDPAGQCTTGVGRQNVQCLFLTPKGEVFHVASGYQSAEDLLSHLEFANALFDSLQDSPGDAERIVQASHRERLKELEYSDAEIANPTRRISAATIEALRRDIADRQNPADFHRHRGRFNVVLASNRVFESKRREAELHDHKYMIEHPLISMHEFLRDPRQLTGYGHSFFASTRGNTSGQKIGQ